MADEEEVDEPEGESLAQYISRLEALTGTERIRVPKEWNDKHGNVILPPEAMYLVDAAGDVHESADTSGAVPVNPWGVGSGNVRTIAGTYTKGATGTVGSIDVIPHADDIIYLMYGQLVMGAARTGGADQVYAGISYGATSANFMQTHVDDAGGNADEIWYFPSLGQSGHDLPQAMSGVYHSFQTAILGSNLTSNNTGTAITGRYLIQVDGMANTELFIVRLFFLSAFNKEMTVTAGTSDTFPT